MDEVNQTMKLKKVVLNLYVNSFLPTMPQCNESHFIDVKITVMKSVIDDTKL